MDCAPTTCTFANADLIPITQLSSTIEDEKERYVRGTVVLLWPYSSSTKQLQILLSEPDFRLRSSRGQVRVTFRGPSAEAVAKSQVGIGDTVLLGLDGVGWEERADEEQGLAGEPDLGLVFVDRVVLEVFRGSHSLGTIDLDAASQPGNETRNSPVTTNPPRTPLPTSPYTQQSPAISQTVDSPFRLNNSSIFDYTEEEDGYVFGKGRKRSKWGRPSSEWVFVDSPPSPIKDVGNWNTDGLDVDVDVDLHEWSETAEKVNPQVRSVIPARTTPENDAGTNANQDSDSGSPAVEMKEGSSLMTSDVGQPGLTSPAPIDAQTPSSIQVQEDFAVSGPMTVREASESGALVENREDGSPAELDDKRTLDGVVCEQDPIPTTPSPGIGEHGMHGTQPAALASVPASPEVYDPEPSGTEIDDHRGIEQVQIHGDEPFHGFEPSSPVPPGTSLSTDRLEPVVESGYLGADARSATSLSIESKIPRQLGETELPEVVDSEEKDPSDDWRVFDDRVERVCRNETDAREETGAGLAREVPEFDVGYNAKQIMDGSIETTIEEHMSDRSGLERYPSDFEGDTDDYASSMVEDGDAPQALTQGHTQTEAIVIDSDDESQIGDLKSEVVENLSPEHGTFLPMQRDEDLTDLPMESFQHEKSERDSQVAGVTLDENMTDVSGRENQGATQVERKTSTQTTHIWLDGCMEYGLGQKQPNSGWNRQTQTPTTSNHSGLSPETTAINSWSIPVRTVSDNPQRPRWPRTLHAGSQMITPGGTQETVNSQSQELSSPLITTPNPPTPQFSQRTRSIISTEGTSEAEQSFDGSGRESVEKDATRVDPKAPAKLTSPSTRPTSEILDPLATGALLQEIDREPRFLNLQTPTSEERPEPHNKPEITTFSAPRSESEITDRNQSPPGITSEPSQDIQPKHDQASQQLSWPMAGIRTRLAYFCPFSLLSENFNSAVDTMSVVASATPVQRGTRKPRDYFTILHLIDPSTAGATVCTQIFRKNKDVLPVASKGDVILLRNFKVRSMDHKPMLCTMGHSSWAVFIQGDEKNVQINGAPVEYDDGERACVTELQRWFAEEGAKLIETNESLLSTRGSTETSVKGGSETDSVSSSRNAKNIFGKYKRSRNSTERRRLTVRHLRHGRRYTDVSPSDSVHKLRDGKLYAHL